MNTSAGASPLRKGRIKRFFDRTLLLILTLYIVWGLAMFASGVFAYYFPVLFDQICHSFCRSEDDYVILGTAMLFTALFGRVLILSSVRGHKISVEDLLWRTQ